MIGILLAVAIPAMQHRAAEKAARGTVNAETLRRIEVLVELVAHATNTALMIYDRRGNANLRESESDRVSQREMVDQLTVYMRDISTMDLPTSTTIRCLGKMRGFLTIMRDLIGPPSAQAIPGSAAYAADWLVPLRHFSNTLLDLIEDGDDFGGRLMEGKSALLQRSADALTAAKAAQR
ncbi:MAG: hypothetical protein EOP38_19800 [Rubrivivax sp.]|nr:MAG: hypothetical protein EOP38_19800 [Rubrivivax sp.]